MTYAEKFDTAMDAIKKRSSDFALTIFPETPENLFIVGYDYKPEPLEVTGVRCSIPYFARNDKRPSKEQVEKATKYLESNPEYTEGDILILYKRKHGKYSSSGGYRIKEIDGKRISFEKEGLLAECARLNELYTLKDGDIHCSYCGKAFPEKDAIERKIISYATYGPGGATNKYCSGECGGYDQMAHEG